MTNGQKVIVVRDEHELIRSYNIISTLNPKVLLQEIVQAGQYDAYSFCCYADQSGKVLFGFVTQKILQYPEGFGTALLCRSIEEPSIYELGKRVIENLGIDGISEVEIMRDEKNDALYIIEINTRHWLQHTLSARLGVDISLLDFYYRTGRVDAVRLILSETPRNSKPVIWFDDVGYLIHCIKPF